MHLGKPEIVPIGCSVSDAAPREVYFLAISLFQKVNRLSFDSARRYIEVPKPPAGDIQPQHVFKVVNSVDTQIDTLMALLGIPYGAEQATIDPSKTPTDVFQLILEVNQKLNALIDRPFSPSDVYQSVTTSIGHAAVLLTHFGHSRGILSAPAFERQQGSADVYVRLLACIERLRYIMAIRGLSMLKLAYWPPE
jgi:hypothetical protein